MEKEEKKSFVLYNDLVNTVEHLPDEVSGKLFKYILKFVNDEEFEIDDLLLKIAFQPIKDSIVRNSKKWEDTKEKKSEAGRIGNLKRWNKDIYERFLKKEISLDEAENLAKNRSATNAIANIAVSVSDNVSVIGSDSVIGSGSVSVNHINNNYTNSSNEESKCIENNKNLSKDNSFLNSEKKEKEKSSAKKEKEDQDNILVDEIFNSWNETKILVHRKFEKPKLVHEALKNISKDELIESFKNYRIMLDEPKFFFKHRWPLETVLKKQQGKAMVNYLRFLPNGDLYENYQSFLSNQNGTKQQSTNSNSEKNNIREYANYDLAGRVDQLTPTTSTGDGWEKIQ